MLSPQAVCHQVIAWKLLNVIDRHSTTWRYFLMIGSEFRPGIEGFQFVNQSRALHDCVYRGPLSCTSLILISAALVDVTYRSNW